jgi:hypothetical protein
VFDPLKLFVEIATAPPGSDVAGRAEALRRFGGRATPAQERLITEAAARPTPPPVEEHRHPAMAPLTGGFTADTLAPADIAFLERLPTDPEQVTAQQARQLAGLAATIKRGTPDRRLLDAVWQPVKDLHDRRAAEAALARVSRPLPAIPDSAVDAIADALLDRQPDLGRAEARARAERMLADRRYAQELDQRRAVADAEARLAEVVAAAERRAALT